MHQDTREGLRAFAPSAWIGDKAARMWLLLALAGAALCLSGLGNHGLWGAQEPYVGGIIREMATSGNWVLPTLNGHPYLEKPPLYYAVGALAARAAGSFAPWVLRIPSALFSLATAAWIAWLAARRSRRAGWWAAMFLLTSDLFVRIGHTAVVDMALVLFVSMGLGLAWLMLLEPERRRAWGAGFWVSLGLAFLAKGPIGPALIGLPVLAYALLARDRTVPGALARPSWGMAVALLLVCGWTAALYHQGGWPFVEEALLRNTVGRFFQLPHWTPTTGMTGEHREYWLFYLAHSPFNLMPWLFLAVPALLAPLRTGGRRWARGEQAFLLVALGIDLCFLSLSGMKRAVYFLPMVPLIFLQLGLWLDRQAERSGRAHAGGLADATPRVMLAVTGGLLFLALVALPWLPARGGRAPWYGSLAFSVAILPLAGITLANLRRRHLGACTDGLLLASMSGLLWMLILLPPMKDPYKKRLDTVFKVAQADARGLGARVMEYGLGEADLGMASLLIQQPMPSIQTPEEFRFAMSSSEPVLVLVAPGRMPGELVAQSRGQLLRPDEGPGPRSGEQGDVLALVFNERAWQRKLASTPPATNPDGTLAAGPGGPSPALSLPRPRPAKILHHSLERIRLLHRAAPDREGTRTP
jgi:4-amino-4-deoxy-L-arabinose transferase-like glycosyltransferase